MRYFSLSLAHTARFLSLATEILPSVVIDEKEFQAYLILKIVVSDKNLLYVFPAHSKFSSPATKIFVLSDENRLYVFPAHSKLSSKAIKIFVLRDENRAVCARL